MGCPYNGTYIFVFLSNREFSGATEFLLRILLWGCTGNVAAALEHPSGGVKWQSSSGICSEAWDAYLPVLVSSSTPCSLHNAWVKSKMEYSREGDKAQSSSEKVPNVRLLHPFHCWLHGVLCISMMYVQRSTIWRIVGSLAIAGKGLTELAWCLFSVLGPLSAPKSILFTSCLRTLYMQFPWHCFKFVWHLAISFLSIYAYIEQPYIFNS